MQIRFRRIRVPIYNTMDLRQYRRKSLGWEKDRPAYIHPRILFGAGMSLEDPNFLKKHKITHVINCAQNNDSPAWFRETYPTRYMCLDAIDSTNANILNWYTKFQETMDRFLKDTSSETIYVHCQCGINRSGFLSLVYACKRLGYKHSDVLKMILEQRPCALTNFTYYAQVKQHCDV